MSEVLRGFVPTDEMDFSVLQMERLSQAQEEICFLLDRGYQIEKIVAFVGNHYQLTARQRLALTRASSPAADIKSRESRRISGSLQGRTVYIDGFNLIITLEAALSHSPLLLCMDGTIRDLCGLHGTYRLIDKTQTALSLIWEALAEREAGKAIFYLDAPVSNSGRLKQEILRTGEESGIPAEAETVPNADALLWDKDGVVTTDAIILNRCQGWINLAAEIIQGKLKEQRIVNLSKASFNTVKNNEGKML